ncbi:MAG: dynamin family protein [Pseudomonadota bacterium]|nr:dynamin family protein [Pseudomonadota bacterium]
MTPSFATSLDALSGWRTALARRLDDASRYVADHDMVDESALAQLRGLRERLASDKLVVAFVAEFSRGKSELINAIFFADTGRRVLPATPGRTTMCPVELGWDPEENGTLLLLPIETRLQGLSLAELRPVRRAWTVRHLPLDDPDRLAEALREVTRTKWVLKTEAAELGFWDDASAADNPPVNAQGLVEVPAWRHAVINYPHPLLKQGLVVLDTPGLNAIGAEPELTLSLLPSAHATVFILGADTGVTRSDLDVWRDHLGTEALSRFVVLNKIDALVDPLASAEQIEAQIATQCEETARTLGVPIERVYALSARQALAARIEHDEAGLLRSRLPALEAALGSQLLPQRRQVLAQAVVDGVQQLDNLVGRRLGDQRRQLAEQMLELRGLRGKSGGKLRLMIERIDVETAEFEQCTVRLQALRTVHTRMLQDALAQLSSDRLRHEVGVMQDQMSSSLLNLGARKSFVALCGRLRTLLGRAQETNDEIRDMLGASFGKLNGEFGFSLAMTKAPDLARFVAELGVIESSYTQYLGLSHALRLAQPKAMEQFRRMLLSKLRVVFENASAALELWNKAVSGQVDTQLRERRRNFRRRRESLERVQTAASDLELRIAELEAQDTRLQAFLLHSRELFEALRREARAAPAPSRDHAPDMIALHFPPSEALDRQRVRA